MTVGDMLLIFSLFCLYLAIPTLPDHRSLWMGIYASTVTRHWLVGVLEVVDPVWQDENTIWLCRGKLGTSTTFNITGTKPSAANPLGNPPYPGWTASGGTNWISDIVAKYNNSLLLSYNLAYGGATVNASLVAPYLPTVYSIIDQVDEFQEYLSPPPSWAPWDAKNTLFAVWIGVNDVAGSWYQTSAAALEREILDQLFEQIEHVYQGGARNFALLTVPPIERTPNIMQGSDPDYTIPRLKAAIEHWNTILVEKAEALAQTHHDAIVKVVDTQPAFNNILDSGGAAADCWNSDGVTCLWFNDFHPGIVIQDAVAQAVAAAWKGSFFT